MTLRLERVKKKHDRRGFDCGKESLNTFLARSARQGEKKGGLRTYVLVDDANPTRVIGYFSLCAGAIEFSSLPAELRKHLPSHRVPTILLARLAVDERFQGRGYGHALLIESFKKAIEAQISVGVLLFEVDAIDEDALRFYRRYGLVSATSDPMKLFLPMETVRRTLEARDHFLESESEP